MPSSPVTTPRSQARRRMPRGLLLALIAVAGLLVVGALAGVALALGRAAAGAPPPAVGTRIVAPSEARAAAASADESATAAERAAAAYLAEQPTAYWLTPEQDPLGEAGARIARLADQAREQRASLAIVIYGLPGRDCGNHSAGGLDEDDYATWTAEIGRALELARDVQQIVILEPDSLALSTECGNLGERAEQLDGAIAAVSGTNTWIYLDGGHSRWHPAATMAGIIRETGLYDSVRGFATNVSNYNSASDEFDYAHALAAELGGGHALIDTSRSGAGSTGEWCNPPGRLVGEPGGTFGDEIVDTNLWIKPPGESDGPCNGGPAAGLWWPEAAVELTRDVQ